MVTDEGGVAADDARRRDESITVDGPPDTPLRGELLALAEELGYSAQLV